MDRVYYNNFEGQFAPYDGVSELKVPAGAVPLWIQGVPEETSKGILIRPEFYQEAVGVSGRAAAFGHVSSTYRAAIAIPVHVLMGAVVEARVLARNSPEKAGHDMRLSIEPFGRVLIETPDMAHSRWWGHYSEDWDPSTWCQLVARTVAQRPIITVVMYAKLDYRINSYSLWDELEVLQEGGEPGAGLDPALRARMLQRLGEARSAINDVEETLLAL